MSPSTHRSRWLTYLWIILGIGLLGNVIGFFLLSHRNGLAAPLAISSPTSTFALYDPAESELETATPFQPLPTNTPTRTPTLTPTITKTPTSTNTPEPTKTDTPEPSPTYIDGLPPEASIDGVVGYAQNHNLSCESRSAVDWARYYGVSIYEDDFQSNLPLAGNPERGFVGNVDDPTGQIPPDSYGVHAPPVAKVLRSYGLSAEAYKNYSFIDLKRQIANGNPVIVWVIGNVWYGYPIEYTAPNGKTVIVAHFEHTAIVVGYDEYGVTLVDNNLVYWRSTEDFLSSWSVLGNMVIVTE